MEGQRVGETGLSESAGPSNQNTHFHPSPNPFFNQGGSAFDFGELEEAIVLRGVKDIGHDEPKSSAAAAAAASALFSSSSRAATLEMFPAWPIRFRHTTLGSGNSGESTESESTGVNTIREPGDSSISKSFSFNNQQEYNHQQQIEMASTADRYKVTTTTTTSMGNTSQHQKSEGTTRSGKVLDAKMLRRLAQNREAARKSRLRKKAYVQQLESSRMKLAQLEQELQRARSQGLFLGGGGGGQPASMSSGATIFDMEYGRWVEEEHRQMAELRTALQSHLIDSELRGMVDSYISHYDDVFRLKAVAAKTDVFHLISGMWTSPAERCFLWIGGFRPSDLIKMLVGQLEPLTEQQLMGIYNLQHSSQQAEEALSQGLEQLQQSLVDTIATTTLTDGMHHMAIALGKLSNLEGFLRQADNLREQTLHQLRRILTTRQAARCMLVIGEYYGRLRALSSLWASRPRETLMSDSNTCPAGTDLQMVPQPHNHFPNF